ncbi:hypothetical protein B0E47_13045 [Rhodanobacter sp. B05]|jgi:hypothetical protein|uniref:hypothetical protein n=1 Tax=Rhodanobacter sp. B05 TaxID=1945859 RepID=UPI000984B0C6|nr:hypothetical protein [Rhodanobacter sp. B05]OOG54092.1 hypothetical protein B0E47_13045 [Rhodanobacter sp. B05]
MSSLWKDLLFLHGHLAHKDDLVWRDQAGPASSTKTAAETATANAVPAAKGGAKPPKDCVLHWPRLAAPR